MGFSEHRCGVLHSDLQFLSSDLHQDDRTQSPSSRLVPHVRYGEILRPPPKPEFLQCPHAEYADISENLFKDYGNFSLVKTLNDPKILPYFISLSITDQPAERPTLPLLPEEREKHLIVKLSVPSGSQVEDTKVFFSSLFQLVDIVGIKLGGALRPETKNKLRKVREDLDKQLKAESAKEKKEEVCYFLSGR